MLAFALKASGNGSRIMTGYPPGELVAWDIRRGKVLLDSRIDKNVSPHFGDPKV
jgi:hypothetical protein